MRLLVEALDEGSNVRMAVIAVLMLPWQSVRLPHALVKSHVHLVQCM